MYKFSDQFYAAVRTLSSSGTIKRRLISAYDKNLAHLPAEELPESVRTRFEELRRAMLTVKPLGTESPVLATVRKMSTVEANRCANQIVTMYNELNQGMGNGERRDRRKADTQTADLISRRHHRSLN
jgi:hypothetical protein